jgi:DNA repair exonuclease SbcCD ATPase subunit
VDAIDILTKFGAPVATGVTGFVGAALNFKRRIEDLEKDFKAHKETVKQELEQLKTVWKKELEWVEDDLRKDFKELKDELEELNDGFEQYQRGSVTDFANADEMRRFMEEQGHQWQTIQRTLGKIEGHLGRPTSAPPPGSPPTRSLPMRPLKR